MLEELEKDGLHLIEWGDDALVEILTSADIPTLTIDIEKQNNNRTYKVNYEHT
jgi:tRNA threonylcarbamoyladenosine biosynthesis protein TsaE